MKNQAAVNINIPKADATPGSDQLDLILLFRQITANHTQLNIPKLLNIQPVNNVCNVNLLSSLTASFTANISPDDQ